MFRYAVIAFLAMCLPVQAQYATIDSAGRAYVSVEGGKNSYRAGATGYAGYGSPTDIFCLRGSDSKVVRVRSIYIAAHANSATQVDLLLLKRLTANTGGTTSTITSVALDSLDPAASGALVSYTTSPTTLGTPTGNLAVPQLVFSTNSGGAGYPVNLDFGTHGGKSVVLRGAAQSLCANFNGAALPASAGINIEMSWTEE